MNNNTGSNNQLGSEDLLWSMIIWNNRSKVVMINRPPLPRRPPPLVIGGWLGSIWGLFSSFSQMSFLSFFVFFILVLISTDGLMSVRLKILKTNIILFFHYQWQALLISSPKLRHTAFISNHHFLLALQKTIKTQKPTKTVNIEYFNSYSGMSGGLQIRRLPTTKLWRSFFLVRIVKKFCTFIVQNFLPV